MRLADEDIDGAPSLAVGLERIEKGFRILGGYGREQWISLTLLGAVVTSVLSIAASSILLGAAFLLWLAGVRRGRAVLQPPPFKWALGAFLAAVAVSIAFSLDPLYSARYLTKTVKLGLLLLAWTYFSRRDVETAAKAVFGLLACSAAYGLLQYEWLLDINLLNRIRGFMSHWMTFSGQLMMAAVGLSSFLLVARARPGEAESRGRWQRALGWAALAVILAALLLSFTRNAWLGTLVGLATLLAIIKRRWILPALALLGIFFLLLPDQFKQRLFDSFDLQDTTTQSRLELLQTGGAMIADHPWTGVGPRMVPLVAQGYRTNHQFPDWLYQHLHNTPLQIAAEMGLLGLAAWLGLWAWLLRDFWRMARASRGRDPLAHWASVNAICMSAAFLASGLLEYNFGDSELLTLMIFFAIAPYVVHREAQAAA